MKRIVLIGAAVAGLFSAGITTAAMAATGKAKYVTVTVTQTKKETKTVYTKASCKIALTTVAPTGTTGVTAGSAEGTQYGNTACDKGLSTGVTRTVYAEDDAGDLTGKIVHWFRGASVYGTFTLTEAAPTGPPTATTFGAASYTGTVKFTGATGTLHGASGTATMKCSTDDSLHYACTETLHLTDTVTTLVKVQVHERKRVG